MIIISFNIIISRNNNNIVCCLFIIVCCLFIIVECPICGNHLSTIKKLKTIQENVIELEQQLNSSQNCDNSALTTTAKCEIESVFYEDGAFAKTRDGQICFCQVGSIRTIMMCVLWTLQLYCTVHDVYTVELICIKQVTYLHV